MTLHVCSQDGCAKLIRKGTRCEAHQRPAPPRTFTRRQGGYDWQWRKIVECAIREQPWCSQCYAVDDLTGDHLTPLSKGGANTRENCRVLCRLCNSRRGNRDAA